MITDNPLLSNGVYYNPFIMLELKLKLRFSNKREGFIMAIKDRSRAQVAALLTIAAMQNIQPQPAIVESAKLLAESVIRVYEQIFERLQSLPEG